MTFEELVFVTADCCGEHMTATVPTSSGTMGITKVEDGLFNVTFYNDKGLVKRIPGLTQGQVEALL